MDNLTLKICADGSPVFLIGKSENVLVPSKESARAAVFHALTNALALLAEITPSLSFCAKAVVTDERSEESEQCRDVCAGDLRIVLPEWSVPSVGVYAVWLPNAPKNGLVKQFVDYFAVEV